MSNTATPGVARAARRALAALLATLLAITGVVVATAAPAHADPVTPMSGSLDWGVKESFRQYVVSPIAHGSITTEGWASTNEGGTFNFPTNPSSAFGEGVVEAAFDGAVLFQGHDGVLEVWIGDLRVDIEGDVGVVIADVVSRPFDSLTVPEPPVVYEDVPLVSLDLTGITPTPVEGGFSWSGIPTTLTEEGVPAFADFYEAGTAFDPLSFTLAEAWEPGLRTFPSSDVAADGQVLVVEGRGYDPDANIGTRPPLMGQSTGVYVVFARVQENWRPSDGGGSSTRQIIDQRWALPAESLDIVDPERTNPAYTELHADGTFVTELLAVPEPGTGAYAVITYAGGGATPNAAQEQFNLVGFDEAFSDVPPTHVFFAEIAWMTGQGVANGYPDGTFRPADVVSRQSAAAFLYRLAGEPEVAEDAPTFPDVPETSPFYDAIRWMAAEGITTGNQDGLFQPTLPVSRQTMAAFLYRYAGEPEVPVDAPTFPDVPETSIFFDAISWMAAMEITTGDQNGNFRPTDVVTRQSTAAFLYRFAHLES